MSATCSMACRMATAGRCSCPCRGANHGTASPRLAERIAWYTEHDGELKYDNGSGATVNAQDYLDGVNDGLRISAEREGRAIPGRLL